MTELNIWQQQAANYNMDVGNKHDPSQAFCKLLYLLEAQEDLSQLSLHTKGRLERPPVDPILFTPRWGSVTAECKRKAHTFHSCDNIIMWNKVLNTRHESFLCMHKKQNIDAWLSEVLYLDLHDWNTLRRVAKSFMLPLFVASTLCFSSASFCFSGLPAGRKGSVITVYSHHTSTLLCMFRFLTHSIIKNSNQ